MLARVSVGQRRGAHTRPPAVSQLMASLQCVVLTPGAVIRSVWELQHSSYLVTVPAMTSRCAGNVPMLGLLIALASSCLFALCNVIVQQVSGRDTIVILSHEFC